MLSTVIQGYTENRRGSFLSAGALKKLKSFPDLHTSLSEEAQEDVLESLSLGWKG